MLSWIVGAFVLGSLARSDMQVEAQFPFELRESGVSTKDWDKLSRDVSGRLLAGTPFAEPCFSGHWNSSECMAIQNNYLDEGTHFVAHV